MAEVKFSSEELDIMKWDWIHCRNVQQVALSQATQRAGPDPARTANLQEKSGRTWYF